MFLNGFAEEWSTGAERKIGRVDRFVGREREDRHCVVVTLQGDGV